MGVRAGADPGEGCGDAFPHQLIGLFNYSKFIMKMRFLGKTFQKIARDWGLCPQTPNI